MNSGLTSLMMHLISSGDEKKKQAEFDRRSALALQHQEDMATYRDALANTRMKEASSLAEQRSIEREQRQSKYAKDTLDAKTENENSPAYAMAYLAGAKDSNGNLIPFNDLKINHQVGIAAGFGGDVSKAAQAYSDLQGRLAASKTASEKQKAIADTADNINKEAVAKAVSKDVARVALAKQKEEEAKINRGGVSASEAAQLHNLTSFDPKTGNTTVTENPFRPKTAAELSDEKTAALLKGSTATGSAGIAQLVEEQDKGSIYRKAPSQVIGFDGVIRQPVSKVYTNTPTAPESRLIQQVPVASLSEFGKIADDAINEKQAHDQLVARYAANRDATPETTLQDIAKKIAAKKLEDEQNNSLIYRLPSSNITDFQGFSPTY